jgi:acetyl esterase/lipase
VTGGESAGAYFALFTAAIAKNKKYYDLFHIDFLYKDIFDVKAAVLICGALDLASLPESKFPCMTLFLQAYTGFTKKELKNKTPNEKLSSGSGVLAIGENFPPCVIIAAKKDLLKEQSDRLQKRFEELRIPHLYLLAGGGVLSLHAFPIAADTKRGRKLINKTLEFLQNNIK